jgi:hypothetical protein
MPTNSLSGHQRPFIQKVVADAGHHDAERRVLFDTLYSLISFRKSNPPPQNFNLIFDE